MAQLVSVIGYGWMITWKYCPLSAGCQACSHALEEALTLLQEFVGPFF
jgi:hypothetical protein